MKKIFSGALLCLMLLTIFCGCEKKPDDEDKTIQGGTASKETVLKLAYSKSEELDPFSVKTVTNTQLMRLVYDGLYKLDKEYNPVPVIAKSSIVSAEKINVTLDNVKFSDGTRVTASDVSYSFSMAKAAPSYSEKLKNFDGVDITAENMLIFRLASPDPYALSCLDFPIVKNGAMGIMPVGSGRYSFSENGDGRFLVVNSSKSGFNPVIKKIVLEPVADGDSIGNSLKIGNSGFYYDDLSDGSFSRINAQTVKMGINNFVYLGFNSENEVFQNQDIRQAINIAINRKEIAETAFQGHARETYSPFNPDWYVLASKDLVIVQDIEKAKQLIKESGIDVSEKEISILVNNKNGFKLDAAGSVINVLEELGFFVRLKDYSPENYTQALSDGLYDLYIGEYRLTPNMNLTPMFDGSVGYGVEAGCASSLRYSQLLGGECELMDFINTFNEDVPFVPVCYRNASVSYTNSMSGDFNCCDGDVFYDIETWRYK